MHEPTTPAAPQRNHIDTARQHLLEQMAALRTAGAGEAMTAELARAKGLSELAQALVNSAKVEVEYLKATSQNSAPFLEVPPDAPYRTPALPPMEPGAAVNGITSIVRHRLKG